MKIHQSLKVKKSEENQLARLKRRDKLIISKFLDPIFVYRIKGDFIIPNCFDLFKGESISMNSLIETVKFMKQIHFRPKGLLIEYDYMELKYFPPISLLIDRLETMGNDFIYRFAQVLKKFENFNVRSKIDKYNKKNNLDHQRDSDVFEMFDEIFDEYQNSFFYILGNQIVDDNDFAMKYFGINDNLKKLFDQKTNEYDIFNEAFLNNISSFLSFDHFEHFITNAAGYMINLMTKNTRNEEKYEEIKCIQKIRTNTGAKSFPLTVIEKIIDQKFFCHICVLDNFITFDSSKIDDRFVSAEKEIINNHQKLMSLYYKKKKI